MKKTMWRIIQRICKGNRNKFIGINNVFTLKFYNRNWLLDVVMVNPLN